MLVVTKSFSKELNCWGKATELVSMQQVLDDNATKVRPFLKASLQPILLIYQAYNKIVLGFWVIAIK